MSRRSLTSAQIRALAVEARKAWDALPPDKRAEAKDAASAAANDPFGVSDAKAYEYWRRGVQLEVTGCLSMSEMTNGHYDRLMSRWKWIQVPESGAGTAEAYAIRDEADARRLRYIIRQTAARANLAETYAQTICRDKSGGRTIDEANAAQLTQVLSTLLNRIRHSARSKRPRTPHNHDRERAMRDGRARLAAARFRPAPPTTPAPILETADYATEPF
ncbi:MAG: hypothetical protein LBC18_03170 [Opitutaceae bacterium]|jgi:hypothetical protein|nr:hypothetical protein [Opitutaceae bacterium]